MNLRICRTCGHPMDPGEGQNGECEDCLAERKRAQNREEQMGQMIRSTNYEQMEMEKFLNG